MFFTKYEYSMNSKHIHTSNVSQKSEKRSTFYSWKFKRTLLALLLPADSSRFTQNPIWLLVSAPPEGPAVPLTLPKYGVINIGKNSW